MRDLRRRIGGVLAAVGLGAALSVAPVTAAVFKIETVAIGLSYENFSRTVSWTGAPQPAKMVANLVIARAELGVGRGAVVSFSVGLPMTTFKGLAFSSLPISLELGSRTLTGWTLGAQAVVPVRRFSDFEISGTGRLVSSFGMSKTWALEGFAVKGQAAGEASWVEAAAGPRLSYLAFGRVKPFVEIWLRWLHARFSVTETLADLGGSDATRVRRDLAVSVSFGADAALTDRLAVRASAGVVPFAGGVDGAAAIGVLYKF